MRSRLALALVAAALFGVLGWVLLESGAESGAHPAELERPAARGTAASAAPPSAPAEPDASFAEREALGPAPQAPVDVPRGSDEMPQAPSDSLVEVRVLEHGTRAPLANAEILVFDEPALHFAKLLRRGTIDATRAQRSAISAADGRATIAVESAACVLFARHGTRSGFLNVRPPTAALELIVAPDSAVRVHVTDLAGAPLSNVPVTLRRRQGRFRSDYGAFTSDARGEVELPHARMLVATGRSDARWSAVVRGVFEQPVGASIAESELDGRVVELRVPPFGACVVEVRDARDQLDTASFDVALDVVRDETRGPEVAAALSSDGVLLDDIVDGRARFALVELGRALEVRAVARASSGSVQVRGMGPMKAGESVTLVVRPAESACVLRGRVSTSLGAPVFGRSLHLQVRRTERASEPELSIDSTLGPSAEFRVSFPAPAESAPRELVVSADDPRRMVRFVARARLPDALPPGEYDLGQMQLEDAPLVATGVVLDDDGTPLRDVSVHLELPRNFGEGEQWWAAGAPHAATDTHGYFELRSSRVPERFRVSSTATRQAFHSPVFDAPVRDLVLRAPANGALAGRILVDQALRDVALRIHLEPSEPSMGEPQVQALDLRTQDGAFELAGLTTGSYEFELRCDDAPDSVTCATLEGLAVLAKRVNRDVRLDPLDLRGLLRRVEIRAVSESGEALAECWVRERVRWSDGRVEVSPTHELGGPRQVLCGAAGVDVRIGAAGHLDVELLGLVEDTEVVLPRAPLVVFTLPPEVVAVLAPGELIGLRLESATFELPAGEAHAYQFFRAERLELAAPALGRSRVALLLLRRSAEGSSASGIDVDPAQFVDLSAAGPREPIEVKLTPADVQRARSTKSGR